MPGRFRRFIYGEPGWSDYLFRTPPKQPDARAVYLGGAGLITAFRGGQTIWGLPPSAYVFQALGDVFITFWGAMWIIVGLVVFVVSLTGHKHPDWDRLSAFAMLMLWWVWGLLYLISVPLDPTGDRWATDLTIGFGLIITGFVLAAGVVQGLRKTHEIFLRETAQHRVAELEQDFLTIAAENERLQLENATLRGRTT